METIADMNKVRAAREKELMSQADLAHKAGVTVSTISRIERGQIECRISTKRNIILALGLELGDVDRLFNKSDSE